MMKKILYIFLAIFAISSITSCKSDDDKNNPSELENTVWKSVIEHKPEKVETTLTFKTKSKATILSVYYLNNTVEDEATEEAIYTYNAPNGTLKNANGNESLIFKIKGNTLIVSSIDGSETMDFTKQ